MDGIQFMIRPRWLWGLPAPVWLHEAQRIRELVDKWDLEPIETAHFGFGAASRPMMKAPTPEEAVTRIGPFPFPFPFPGGLRIAHLHLGDRVFLLDDRQWKEFSSSVVKEMQTRLSQAERVNVQELTELSESIMGL